MRKGNPTHAKGTEGVVEAVAMSQFALLGRLFLGVEDNGFNTKRNFSLWFLVTNLRTSIACFSVEVMFLELSQEYILKVKGYDNVVRVYRKRCCLSCFERENQHRQRLPGNQRSKCQFKLCWDLLSGIVLHYAVLNRVELFGSGQDRQMIFHLRKQNVMAGASSGKPRTTLNSYLIMRHVLMQCRHLVHPKQYYPYQQPPQPTPQLRWGRRVAFVGISYSTCPECLCQ